MTKADIAERIQEKLGITLRESKDLLDATLETMKSTLEAGENVKINGFGIFSVKKKNPRKGRNPATSEPMILDGRRVVTFKASPVLRESVNSSTLEQAA